MDDDEIEIENDKKKDEISREIISFSSNTAARRNAIFPLICKSAEKVFIIFSAVCVSFAILIAIRRRQADDGHNLTMNKSHEEKVVLAWRETFRKTRGISGQKVWVTWTSRASDRPEISF